jgi:ribose transport system ATP-binding protein
MSAPLLRMTQITKRFGGIHALRGVDFELREGEVHALLGENGAGKSTLINVLSGVYPEHGGTIEIRGAEVAFSSPADAQAAGVATIHQELDLVPDTSVAENLFLGREPRTRLRLLDRRRLTRMARGQLQRIAVDVDPSRTLRSLRVGEQQLVEIAKALSLDARILVMDEPTSALADAEVEQLFAVIGQLRRAGVGVVYVSHRLEELAAIADRATVLRDGQLAGTVAMRATSRGQLISMMVGQPLGELFPKGDAHPGEALLEVERLTVVPRRPRPGRSEPRGVSLRVRRGEIVGLAGLMGAGRTELLETLYGAGPPGRRTGSVRLDGEPFAPASPRAALAAGVGFVPEDRKGLGLVLEQSVAVNVTLAALRRYVRVGLVRSGPEREAVDRAIADVGIKTGPGGAAAVGTLSGGNQQKVVFAKQLLVRPRLLLLDEPTRGVDVGAKAEIYRLLVGLAEHGLGILMASSELPELLGVCDRIVVLRAGAVARELDAAHATQQDVLEAATAGAAKEAA